MNNIGKKISDNRKAKGLTQEELAELSKMNLRTIQRIENNKTKPRRKSLALISDALGLDIGELTDLQKQNRKKETISSIVNGFFLVILNIVLMVIFGYLTLDQNANVNSLVGAALLSFFLPVFIVYQTREMTGLERMLKFGSGLIIYMIFVLIKVRLPVIILTGFFPTLIIALAVLYYGNRITGTK